MYQYKHNANIRVCSSIGKIFIFPLPPLGVIDIFPDMDISIIRIDYLEQSDQKDDDCPFPLPFSQSRLIFILSCDLDKLGVSYTLYKVN